MDALVATRVAVGVVDDHVVRGDGEVNPQLITGQTALGLGRAEYSGNINTPSESPEQMCDQTVETGTDRYTISNKCKMIPTTHPDGNAECLCQKTGSCYLRTPSIT